MIPDAKLLSAGCPVPVRRSTVPCSPHPRPSSSPPRLQLPQTIFPIPCPCFGMASLICLFMTPLCPGVRRGILKQRPLLKNAWNATRNRTLVVANEKKGAPVGALIERQAGALVKRKRLDFLWFSWLTEVVIIEKKLALAAAVSGWPQHGGQQHPVCCRGFYGESPFLLAQGRCAPGMQD